MKLVLLGRERKVYKEGRLKFIIYKKEKLSLGEARRLEKQLNKQKVTRQKGGTGTPEYDKFNKRDSAYIKNLVYGIDSEGELKKECFKLLYDLLGEFKNLNKELTVQQMIEQAETLILSCGEYVRSELPNFMKLGIDTVYLVKARQLLGKLQHELSKYMDHIKTIVDSFDVFLANVVMKTLYSQNKLESLYHDQIKKWSSWSQKLLYADDETQGLFEFMYSFYDDSKSLSVHEQLVVKYKLISTDLMFQYMKLKNASKQKLLDWLLFDHLKDEEQTKLKSRAHLLLFNTHLNANKIGNAKTVSNAQNASLLYNRQILNEIHNEEIYEGQVVLLYGAQNKAKREHRDVYLSGFEIVHANADNSKLIEEILQHNDTLFKFNFTNSQFVFDKAISKQNPKPDHLKLIGSSLEQQLNGTRKSSIKQGGGYHDKKKHHMKTKVFTGKNGGRYTIKNGRKVYIKSVRA